MKVLITGGLGNLGQWLTEALIHQSYEVTVLARTCRPLPIEWNQKVEPLFVDITDPANCKRQLTSRHFDYVIHLASANEQFEKDYALKALQVNAWGTRNVLECLVPKSIKNFIYFSTFHVYGKQSGLVTEETPLRPNHDYALTHLFAEDYIQQFHRTRGLPYTILRLTNSYGAPKNIHSSKWYLLLNDLSRTAFTHHEIVLKSNGEAERDFIWMGDVCEVIAKILEKKKALNDIFNLSAEQTYALKAIAQFVQEAYQETFGKRLPIQLNQEDKTIPNRGLVVSSKKLKAHIPFQASNRIKEEAKAIFDLLRSTQDSSVEVPTP